MTQKKYYFCHAGKIKTGTCQDVNETWKLPERTWIEFASFWGKLPINIGILDCNSVKFSAQKKILFDWKHYCIKRSRPLRVFFCHSCSLLFYPKQSHKHKRSRRSCLSTQTITLFQSEYMNTFTCLLFHRMEMVHQTRKYLVPRLWICFECFGMSRWTDPSQHKVGINLFYM